ncbi:MAG: cobalamin biosynthesis protein [Candidatus Methanomethylicia archaeon]
MEVILALIILILSILLDIFYGEPKGRLLRLHPVVLCASISRLIVKPNSSRIHGLLTFTIPVSIVLAIYFSIQYLALQLLGILGYVIVSVLILKTTFSINLLYSIVVNAYKSMESGNWNNARHYVQQIVRRNVYVLDEEHTVSAAIESLFESLVDGYISPLFYYPFLGVKGSLLQRAVNTMDSLVAYKTPEYMGEGYVSAKADTILNYVPARLTAILIIISSAILKLNWRRGLKILLRDHSKTESLNAGWPISAIAGVLNVKLEKINAYSIGDPGERLTPKKIMEAIKIYKLSTILATLLILTLTIIVRKTLPWIL